MGVPLNPKQTQVLEHSSLWTQKFIQRIGAFYTTMDLRRVIQSN